MKKRKTYTIFILAIIFMVFSIGVLLFLFKEIKIKNENISIAQKNLGKKNIQKNNISNLARTIQDTKNQREILDSYIVDEAYIDEFIGWLEDRGEPVGASILVNSVERSSKANILKVSLTASGDFDSVLRFNSFLENSNYKINIDKLFLSKVIREEGEEGLAIEYWQGQVTFFVVSGEPKKEYSKDNL